MNATRKLSLFVRQKQKRSLKFTFWKKTITSLIESLVITQ